MRSAWESLKPRLNATRRVGAVQEVRWCLSGVGRDLPASSPGGAPPAATDGDDELDISSLLPASVDTVMVLVAGFCVFRATERLCAIATRGRWLRFGRRESKKQAKGRGGEAGRRQRQRRRRAGPLKALLEREREGGACRRARLWHAPFDAIAGFCARRDRCKIALVGAYFFYYLSEMLTSRAVS